MEFTKITENNQPKENQNVDIKLNDGSIHKDFIFDTEEMEGRYLGSNSNFTASEVESFRATNIKEKPTGEVYPDISFKNWITELCDWDGEYSFLLEGNQTGEIYDMHDHYISGKTAYAAMIDEHNEHG